MQQMATEKNPFLGRLHYSIFRTRNQCAHGPQSWPWWKLFTFKINHLSVYLPSTGRGVWIYTRWGAVAIDLTIDRRGTISPEGRGW